MDAYNAKFKEYLDGLTVEEYGVVSSLIREECGLTSAQLYNMRHGRTKIKFIYRVKIAEIIGKNIFD